MNQSNSSHLRTSMTRIGPPELTNGLDQQSDCEPHFTSTPIHLLPVEVLVLIFQHVLSPPCRTPGDSRKTLAKVCQHWEAVLNGAPVLWSTISCGDGPESITEALNRSAGLELDFRALAPQRVPGPDTPPNLEDLLPVQGRFWCLALQHRSRWRAVEFEFAEAQLSLSQVSADLVEPVRIPFVEEITLSSIGGTRAIDFFHGPLQRLRRLSLENFSIYWHKFDAPLLTAIQLVDIRHYPPSLLQIYNILSACPLLEEITIKSVGSLLPTSSSPPQPVHLNRLRKLSVTDGEAETLKWFLCAIHIPLECAVTLGGYIDQSPETALFPSHLPHLPIRCLSGAATIQIQFGNGILLFRLTGLWSFNLLSLRVDFHREMLRWLGLSETAAENSTPIEMYWAGFFPSKTDGYLASLSGFQCIRCLTMDTSSTWALSNSLGARNDGWSVSFPGLEQISISLTETHNHIFDWVSQLLNKRRTIHRNARTTDRLRVIKFEAEDLSTNSAIETLQAPEGEHFLSLLDVARILDVQIWWDGVLKSSERDEDAAPV